MTPMTATTETRPTSWVTVQRWPSRIAEPPDTLAAVVEALPPGLRPGFLHALAEQVRQALTEENRG